MNKTIRLLSLLTVLALSAQADNFLAPSRGGGESATAVDGHIPEQQPASAAVPVDPLPPIEPIFTPGSAPAENDRVMAVQKLEFWVQMGAFQNQEGAKALETKLKAHGLNVRIFGADLHRVAVGPYASRDQAGRSLETLRAIEKEAFLTTPERLVQ